MDDEKEEERKEEEKEKEKEKEEERKQTIGKANRAHQRKLQEHHKKIQQFTLATQKRGMMATDKNYTRYEGMITNVFEVKDLYASKVDENRLKCLDLVEQLGIETTDDSELNSTNTKMTKKKTRQTQKEKEDAKAALKRQRNLLLYKDAYDRCLLDLQAPLDNECIDLATPNTLEILPRRPEQKTKYVLGKTNPLYIQNNKQRIDALLGKKSTLSGNNNNNEQENFTHDDIINFRQRSRYWVHFQLKQTIKTMRKLDISIEEEEEEDLDISDALESREKTMQQYKTQIDDQYSLKEKREVVHSDYATLVGFF